MSLNVQTDNFKLKHNTSWLKLWIRNINRNQNIKQIIKHNEFKSQMSEYEMLIKGQNNMWSYFKLGPK